METKRVHKEQSRERTAAVGVRLPVSTLRLVEAIQSQKGHLTRNETLAEAVFEYIERNSPMAGRAA